MKHRKLKISTLALSTSFVLWFVVAKYLVIKRKSGIAKYYLANIGSHVYSHVFDVRVTTIDTKNKKLT